MKRAMERASTDIMRCDPPQSLLDINSFSLTYFLGSYYLSTDQIGMRCSGSCKDINTVNKLACKTDLKDGADVNVPKYCPKRPCYGRLHSCTVRNAYQFCEANEGAGRRYWWIEKSVNGERRNSCDGRVVDTMTRSACTECMCECAEEGAESTATRTFSLMSQYADIKNNMVVSNVRLRKKDNVVQIQIEQAPLRPGGTIDRDNASWVPLDKLVYSQNVPEGAFWKIKDGKKIGLAYDEDYTYLRYNRKTLFLDDVAVEKDYVVTGVRFRNAEANNADGSWNLSPIQLEVLATKFDYQNGILTPDKNEPFKRIVADEKTQRGKQHYATGRSTIKLLEAQDPLKSPTNEVISHPNQQISFRRSSKKEIGQLTVPYFDSRPAASSSFIPLSGIGIFHRGARNYAGFIAPKLIGIDHSQYVDSDLTNVQSHY
ncbi:uncharacterized protein LOC130673131 [Microplitis mediator]|uniref:uncharacterized protein LOC130673131 n=1 Tax=Microplitis mediator TaxID=375433 RepID=UPI002555AEEB|nr:uncharacterized protein LOC130673131 [Microplitis mediator]